MAVKGFDVCWDETDELGSGSPFEAEILHRMQCLTSVRLSLGLDIPAPSPGVLARPDHRLYLSQSGGDFGRALILVSTAIRPRP